VARYVFSQAFSIGDTSYDQRHSFVIQEAGKVPKLRATWQGH